MSPYIDTSETENKAIKFFVTHGLIRIALSLSVLAIPLGLAVATFGIAALPVGNQSWTELEFLWLWPATRWVPIIPGLMAFCAAAFGDRGEKLHQRVVDTLGSVVIIVAGAVGVQGIYEISRLLARQEAEISHQPMSSFGTTLVWCLVGLCFGLLTYTVKLIFQGEEQQGQSQS